MQTYYFVAASRRFLLEQEPLAEVLKERQRHYQSQEKALDFWLVESPAFLAAPALAEISARIPQPAAAVITTDPQMARWLKLRLEHVALGEFQAPSDQIPDALASLVTSA